MKHVLVLIALFLAACSSHSHQAAGIPTEPRLRVDLLSEPSAEVRGLGRVCTVDYLGSLAPLSDVVITPDLSTMAPPSPAELEHLVAAGRPVRPVDPILEAWSYSPWCAATFEARGQRWHVLLHLGGMGLIADERGQKALFRFHPPRGGE
jgi:hypothetical protein